MAASSYEPGPLSSNERTMERIIIVVGRGYGVYVAHDLLREFAQYGCDVLYEEDRNGDDIVEVWATYLSIEVENWLKTCEPVIDWKRRECVLLFNE